MNTRWPKVKLSEVLKPIWREEKVIPLTEYRLLGARWYGGGLFIKEVCLGQQIRADRLYRIQKGDFVYNRLFAWKGSFALAGPGSSGCYVSNEFPCFQVDQNHLDSNFLWWYFRREITWNEALKLSTGATPTSRNRLKEQIFLNFEIPLPALAEQRRIAAKIDQLATKIDEACSLRQHSFQEAEHFLTVARQHVFGNAAAKAWSKMKLNEVAPINMGQSPPGESYNDIKDGLPLLNGPTEFGEKHPTAVQWTSAPTRLCKPGDILLCVRGATTGRMNWADEKYCIGRGLAALTVEREICEPEYVYHFVATQTHEMLALAAGSTFPNLPGAKLKNLDIFVPHLSEQLRIVAQLDALQAEMDALKRQQTETAEELHAMLPSILDKAFKGEL